MHSTRLIATNDVVTWHDDERATAATRRHYRHVSCRPRGSTSVVCVRSRWTVVARAMVEPCDALVSLHADETNKKKSILMAKKKIKKQIIIIKIPVNEVRLVV